MRVREWYGWHFPEMSKIVTQNMPYVRTVIAVGNKKNFAAADLSEILEEELEAEVKTAAEMSMGPDVRRLPLAVSLSVATSVHPPMPPSLFNVSTTLCLFLWGHCRLAIRRLLASSSWLSRCWLLPTIERNSTTI